LEKLKECIHKLYLSDLLGILNYKAYYRDKLLIKNLYYKKPNHNDVKKSLACLSSLRNCVMHFNFKQFSKNRKNYINAIIFFENHLNCFMRKINYIDGFDNPTVKGILEVLYLHYPDIFEENDRLLCDVFDDIAILNGRQADELPQYWSILRQKYELLRKAGKIKPEITNDKDNTQMSFFDLLEQ
jgi:hypothetical protein